VTTTLTINVPYGAEGQLPAAMQSAIISAISRAVTRINSELRDIAPVRTGRLRQSFSATAEGEGIKMEWDTPYAEVADIGAPPHGIDAAEGNPLTFFGRDGWVRTYHVNHPGYVGSFYRLKVGQQAMVILNEEMMQALSRMRVGA